jgi:hypothetical protein
MRFWLGAGGKLSFGSQPVFEMVDRMKGLAERVNGCLVDYPDR